LFVQFLARRSAKTQADLIDQLFNNSERRLAPPDRSQGISQPFAESHKFAGPTSVQVLVCRA
jgi:hypothetical protein